MEIALKSDYPHWDREIAISDHWTSVELTETLLLRYTKKGNRLPLTRFDVGFGLPCFDKTDQKQTGYPHLLEIKTYSECIESKLDVAYTSLQVPDESF